MARREFDYRRMSERQLLILLLERQDDMMGWLQVIYGQGEVHMARYDEEFTNLVKEVEETQGAANSTKVYVEGLIAKLNDLEANMHNDEDAAKVRELADKLQGVQDSLPKAVEANPAPAEQPSTAPSGPDGSAQNGDQSAPQNPPQPGEATGGSQTEGTGAEDGTPAVPPAEDQGKPVDSPVETGQENKSGGNISA